MTDSPICVKIGPYAIGVIMGLFGWSLPPGCHTLPGEEDEAMDLTPFVTLTDGVVGVFWDEYGRFFEAAPTEGLDEGLRSRKDIPALEWNDALNDEGNIAAAAKHYMEHR